MAIGSDRESHTSMSASLGGVVFDWLSFESSDDGVCKGESEHELEVVM